MASPRIELGSRASETPILSIVLQGLGSKYTTEDAVGLILHVSGSYCYYKSNITLLDFLTKLFDIYKADLKQDEKFIQATLSNICSL